MGVGDFLSSFTGSIANGMQGAIDYAQGQASSAHNILNLNEANSDYLDEQRAWEKMMSDTAVQRRVADIKAAGLNPWLALNGGSLGEASTPSSAAQRYDSSAEKLSTSFAKSALSAFVSISNNLLNAAVRVGLAGMSTATNAGSKAIGTIIKTALAA